MNCHLKEFPRKKPKEPGLIACPLKKLFLASHEKVNFVQLTPNDLRVGIMEEWKVLVNEMVLAGGLCWSTWQTHSPEPH